VLAQQGCVLRQQLVTSLPGRQVFMSEYLFADVLKWKGVYQHAVQHRMDWLRLVSA